MAAVGRSFREITYREKFDNPLKDSSSFNSALLTSDQIDVLFIKILYGECKQN